MSDEFPPMIGKYKVTGIVAKGGMGVVYKAIHPSLKRYVVIKKMTARGKSTNGERFKKEAQILLDLQSPYIVHLFDYFTEGGFRYMVEELVDGAALDKVIEKETALPVPVAMLFMQDACYALKYAHSKEIVHRDIKPGNILISKRGEIKLADFGIASDAEGDTITQSGVALGTPAYMPPEQFEDSSKVDRRADIYALGIMLYEMVTGTKPYPGTFSVETLNTIKKGKYISPRQLDKTIPPSVCRLIHKMIRPKAKSRFQSIDGVLKAVKRYLSHYDTHELRVQVAKSVLNDKTYEFPVIEPKDKVRRLITRIVSGVVAASAVFAFCWKCGFIHRTILSPWYACVSVQMEMPKSLLNVMDLPSQAVFFENDNDEIPEIMGSRRIFIKEGSRFIDKINIFKPKIEVDRPAAKNQTYVMNDVFVKKHGDYRLKVVVGPYVWWKSFSVADEDISIKCDFLKNTHRSLKIRVDAYDSQTFEKINNPLVRLNYKGNWKPLSEIPETALRSATVWKIKISAENYSEETYSLLIDWYQDDLIVSAALSHLNSEITE
ncbi:serine/threonine-protein kinase [Treponema sp. C6A8]|uniref:serine/threonine protein kinase n=1 Tax=Treponema sp. C6A8 TaxID=1410609 RepID=UPI000488FAFA|nr:serine/threonine-protein kinase [Treponema sp. C6A8]